MAGLSSGTTRRSPLRCSSIDGAGGRLTKGDPDPVSHKGAFVCYAGAVKIAIYARVSTRDKCPVCKRLGERRQGTTLYCETCRIEFQGKGQDTENQLAQLRAYASAQGWEIVTEFIDRKTAKTGDRDQFKLLFVAAERKEFDTVLVWALDRFTREGIMSTFNYIDQLTRVGCRFYSLTEEHFRTTGPQGELMIAVAAWMAKQERVRISERTKAGLAIARSKGHIGGRKPKEKDEGRIKELRSRGLSLVRVAELTGVSRATVDRVCRRYEKTSQLSEQPSSSS
jgi:DNA invertase Pin-like site-specific DNA recombinase